MVAVPFMVRRIGSDDWATLRDLRLSGLLQAPQAYGSTFTREVDRDDAAWRLFAGRGAWFAVDDDGRAVGLVCGLDPEARGSADAGLVGMWVEPDWWGTGAGGALLDAVIGWARDIGAPGLALEVADGNERAQAFYARAGFVPTGHSEPLSSDTTRLCREQRIDL
jgi:GNAT superfamily N-acetyltransferase